MKIAKIIFSATILQALLAVGSTAHAESASGTFGVTIVLRTFSEAATADSRCVSRGQDGQAGTLRISCPASVDVQAIASASTRQTGQYLRMNASADQADPRRLAVVAGQTMNSAGPVELTISW